MNKKTSKRQRDIKTKLMAAICMLLVSSIMMVSTTYAWFTLSTAPEVTGITTAVGANGNLEMALQRPDGNSALIASSTGDSNLAWNLKNLTWGNIVDLSSNADYGLDKIMLYPAKLNDQDITDDSGNAAKKIKDNPLSTPVYGSDGRMAGLAEKTITGLFNGTTFNESYDWNYNNTAVTLDDAKGVRAIGVSSGMSERQLTYRSALSDASTAGSQAKSKAANSLKTHGNSLADIAIRHALAEDDTGAYTVEDVAVLTEVATQLDAALDEIDTALVKYALAHNLADASDADFSTVQGNFTGKTVAQIDESLLPVGYTGTDGFIAKLSASQTAVQNALDELELLTTGPFDWEDIRSPMDYLVSTTAMKINGYTVAQVQADKNTIANAIFKDGLLLTMESGAGVYADIADFCGNYQASIVIPEVNYGSFHFTDIDATMSTATKVNPVYLKVAEGNVAQFVASSGSSTSNAINDFYGYIIDLAFKTNAADSSLQLQTEGIDRVYDGRDDVDVQNENTMGGGASMTFTPTSDTFMDAQAKALMTALRVVFFDTDSNEIIGYARLDCTDDVNTVTGTITTEVDGVSTTSPDYSKVDDGTDGSITMELVMTDAAGVPVVKDGAENPIIMPLAQNTVHELSVMVYLDGESITNADVAYDAVSSMTGTMNLQFSSTADLKAMVYTDLVRGVEPGETTATQPSTPTVTQIDSSKITVQTTGYSATAYHSSGVVGAVITNTTDSTAVTSGTVTINGQQATYSTEASAWVITGVTDVPDAVTITVA